MPPDKKGGDFRCPCSKAAATSRNNGSPTVTVTDGGTEYGLVVPPVHVEADEKVVVLFEVVVIPVGKATPH